MNKYNVLWLDDEPEKNRSFVEECAELGIILHNYAIREEGISAFQREFDKWDAVLLDAEMPEKSANEVADIDGLSEVERLVAQYSNKRNIPVFISTGKDHLKENKAFVKSHSAYVYVKGLHILDKDGNVIRKGDNELIEDMLEEMSKSESKQIEIIYSDVYTAMDRMKFDENANQILTEILLALHFPGVYEHFNPALYYNQLRQFIEYFFRTCNSFGLIPNCCISNNIVNLNQSSLYLAGKNCEIYKVRYGKDGERIVPEYIETILRNVLEIGNVRSHTVELSSEDKSTLETFFRTSNSKYLIFSFALQMCELVCWLDGYTALHDNIAANAEKCKVLDSSFEEYENKEFIVEQDEKNNFHCGECRLSYKSAQGKVGQRVTLYNVTVSNTSSMDGYKYFAKFKLIE